MKRAKFGEISLLILVTAFLFAIAGCLDGDGDGAPADITGTWAGTMTYQGQSTAATVTAVQTGTTVDGTFDVAGLGSTPFTGTYENGTLTVTVNETAVVITFTGNTATGTATDGADVYTLELTKQ